MPCKSRNSVLGKQEPEMMRRDGALSKWFSWDYTNILNFELPCASASKWDIVRNVYYGNKFDLHENEPVGGTRFRMNGFARRLVLLQRQKASRK